MKPRFDSQSRFGPTLGFEDAPPLVSGRPRCSLELFAWRVLAAFEGAVILILLGVLVSRG